MIKIITDSSSDIEFAEAEKLEIEMIPMKVRFGDEVYIDQVTITRGEFYEKLAAATELPVTSLINPSQFVEEFNKYPNDEIITILLGQEMSGTYQSAMIAKDELKRDNITIIESESVTGGLNLLVKIACQLRDSGKSVEEIRDHLKGIKGRLEVVAMMDTLKYAVKGGRLSVAEGVIGEMLAIKPLINVRHGLVKNIGKARGVKAAIKEIIDYYNKNHDPSLPVMAICSAHTDSLDILFKELNQRMDYCNVGSAVGTHTGPGALGLAFFNKNE